MIRRLSILTVFGLVIGIVVGTLAVGFVEAILWLNDMLAVSPESRMALADRSTAIAMTIGIPAAGGLIVGLLALAVADRRFPGPPDAIRAAQSVDSKVPVKDSLLAALAACISLGCGASVGQYGPLVHLGAACGSWLRRTLNSDRSFGNIGIACGAAAAISAAFHAPIAGLIFAREVILRHSSLRAFAPIAVASTVAYVVAQVIFRRDPLFQIEQHIVAHPYEYAVFIAIGIGGALLAIAYMRAIEFAGHMADRLHWPLPLKTAVAGLALGIVALELPEVLGMGQDVLRQAMAGNIYDAGALLQILLAKLALTALCLGFGFAGGVFSPALLIGTLFGALVGAGTGWVLGGQVSHVAVYAVCGLVAVASPVIGAPLTTVLIVFELTQNFDLATAAIVSVAFANLIGYRMYGRSLFDVQLLARGFDLSLGRDKVMAQQYTIGELLSDHFTKGMTGDSLEEIRDLLAADRNSEAYIVDDAGAYVGTITLQQLVACIAAGEDLDQAAGNIAQPEEIELDPDTSIWDAMAALQGFVGESIPVVADGKLVGALSESTIVSAYLEIVQDVRREEHAAV
ncbi:MAG: chloride channel protein [Woeseiaceae bacterium]